jgi:hypothetical protein
MDELMRLFSAGATSFRRTDNGRPHDVNLLTHDVGTNGKFRPEMSIKPVAITA